MSQDTIECLLNWMWHFKVGQSSSQQWAFDCLLWLFTGWARHRKKEWGGFYFSRHFLGTQLVSCWLFIFLRVVSGFDVQCYTLQLWCRWQDAKGFVQSPLGLALGKALLMLFVITVHRNQDNVHLWKYVVNYTKGIFDNITSVDLQLNLMSSYWL